MSTINLFIFYFFSDDIKTDPNIKNYLDHLGKCTAEELSMFSLNMFHYIL